jgi:hypothetical protein
MVATVLDLLFGCRHKRYTRPITPIHRPGTPAAYSYVACLDCGKQFEYDTQQMRIGPSIHIAVGVAGHQSRHFQVQR